jgi:predicted flap endonuclease-1-like 5' DNA nuclease
MWDVFFRRWVDLLFWWVPRKDQTSRRAGQAQREKAPEPAPRTAEPSARTAPKQPAQQPAQAEGRGASAAEPSARPAPKPTAAQPEKTVAPPVPDDLTVIKGIGPAVQNKLRALGITTFADLAAADPDAILRGLKGSQPLTKGKVQAWTEAARERART